MAARDGRQSRLGRRPPSARPAQLWWQQITTGRGGGSELGVQLGRPSSVGRAI